MNQSVTSAGPASPVGLHRVLEPSGDAITLPQAARRLDARREIWPSEVRIAIDTLNLDAASYRQLAEKHRGADGVVDGGAVREEVLAIVAERGKMQNPVTGSGGMLIGTVEEVGPDSALGLTAGDRVATLVSLSLTPLAITDGLTRWDGLSEQVPAAGHAILFERSIAAVIPDDLDPRLSLMVMDVCGAPALVARIVGDYAARAASSAGAAAPSVLVLGGAGKSGSLSLAAARESGADRLVAVVPALLWLPLGVRDRLVPIADDEVGLPEPAEGIALARLHQATADERADIFDADGLVLEQIGCLWHEGIDLPVAAHDAITVAQALHDGVPIEHRPDAAFAVVDTVALPIEQHGNIAMRQLQRGFDIAALGRVEKPIEAERLALAQATRGHSDDRFARRLIAIGSQFRPNCQRLVREVKLAGQHFGIDQLPRVPGRQADDDVAQLAHIAGKRVVQPEALRVGRKAERQLLRLRRIQLSEMLDKQQFVVAHLA